MKRQNVTSVAVQEHLSCGGLGYILLMDKRSRFFSVVIGAHRSQSQFWRLMEVEGGITSVNGSQFSRKHKLLIPN